MTDPIKDENATPLHSVGRVLDSRWMMAFAVLAVLVAIAWALVERGPVSQRAAPPGVAPRPVAVELLGVPAEAEILLDGKRIDNSLFGVTPGTRHALEVNDTKGRTWRQVFLAQGSISLVVELRTHFVEVEVRPNGGPPETD
jgi:hypothetical protein